MSKKEILKKVIENNGGIAKTSDFAANGINKYEVASFCKEGIIERIRRGFYQLPQSRSRHGDLRDGYSELPSPLRRSGTAEPQDDFTNPKRIRIYFRYLQNNGVNVPEAS